MRLPGSRTTSELRLSLRNSLAGTVMHNIRASVLPGGHESANDNVFHCCVQKTASQWLRSLLSDPAVRRNSGLRPYHYQTRQLGGYDPRPLTQRTFDRPFPRRTLISPLYISYEAYASIPKPFPYVAFFVMRDPRDIVVSSYYSIRYSHGPRGDVQEGRQALEGLSHSDGLRFVIDHLEALGLFAALGSWADNANTDPAVLSTRFEDLAGPRQREHLRRLFVHCDVDVDDAMLSRLLERYSFQRLAGRAAGVEDQHAHYRKGVSGDWREHFDGGVQRYFEDAGGIDLTERLGY